ncbi:MAG: hypothetical protein ABIH27_01250 [Candidatus Omnitrophota bacterium]
MRKLNYGLMVICLILLTANGYCADSSPEDAKYEAGRYRIYTSPSFMVLLDTETGKVWKINSDATGKLKAEGASVEGIAYSNSDLDVLRNKVADMNLDNVPEKNKKECKNSIFSLFSYGMDTDKINKVLKNYKENK